VAHHGALLRPLPTVVFGILSKTSLVLIELQGFLVGMPFDASMQIAQSLLNFQILRKTFGYHSTRRLVPVRSRFADENASVLNDLKISPV
jgi:hypothetical protein